MRPIKFRIVSTKTTQNKILGKEEVCETGWYHKYIDQPTSEGPVRGIYERNQFTGRLDSNGEEVYEGDLIQTMDNVFEVK